MQRTILGLIVMLAALSCTGVSARTPDLEQPAIQIRPTGSPYVRVTAGSVSGLVPHGWQAVPMDGNDFHEGFVASPHPDTWPEMRPSTAGLVGHVGGRHARRRSERPVLPRRLRALAFRSP